MTPARSAIVETYKAADRDYTNRMKLKVEYMTMTQNDKLTPKQALAVFHYVNPEGKAFGHKSDAYLAAGYKQTKTYVQAACNLFALPKVKQAVKQCRNKLETRLEQSAEISKEYALAQLQRVYQSCFEGGRCIDRPSAVATVRLMMQKNGLLTDRREIDHQFRGYLPPAGNPSAAVEDSKRRHAECEAQRKAAERTEIPPPPLPAGGGL